MRVIWVVVLSTAWTVDPAGSGVMHSVWVVVAATGAAVADDDTAALGADAADGAGVPTDCKVPDPLLAGPQATRPRQSTPAVMIFAGVPNLVLDIGWPPSSGQSSCGTQVSRSPVG